jgi:protein O-GlcNAc transferase
VERSALRLTTEAPDDAYAWKMMGAALLIQKKPALRPLQRAAELMPDDAEVLSHLGAVLKDLGRLHDAIRSLRRALEIDPDQAATHNCMGAVLRQLGQLDDAAISYRSALAIKPDYAEAHSNLGSVLKALGRLDEAVVCYRQALAISPEFAEAHNNLAVALRTLGQIDEAVLSYRRALEIKPDYAVAHNNLGAALKARGSHQEALLSLQRALVIRPQYVEALSNLGLTFQELGRHDDAIRAYRQALSIQPEHPETRSNLLFCLTHSSAISADDLFAEHCQFGTRFDLGTLATSAWQSDATSAERKLRIGFVSADFRTHPVMVLFEPILKHLAGNSQLSLHAYSNHTIDDDVTRQLRQQFAQWELIVGLNDVELAEKIRRDQIDILIDLSGHTAHNRLLTFARKPAPVQASWIGYPGTTGLKSMDYYFADHALIPDENFSRQFVEKIVYLPAGATFLPSPEAPPVNVLPALSNGYLTFGSFNRLSKLSPLVIACWARLLRAVPDSRMVIGALPLDAISTVTDWFRAEAIAPERLHFFPRCDMKSYLGLYHQVDLCLDAFPYNGATTSGHALWMGVPTLTMAGETAASRAGATFLNHAGLEGFVAHNRDEFLSIGLRWANDLAALTVLRTSLRTQCELSAMCQPELVAEALTRALRTMWRRHCDGLQAQSFDA